jgi:GNAT superfamily N-acetyltransferase
MRTQIVRRCAPQSGAETIAIEIRAARMDDAARVGDFLAALSLHSQTLRFFTGISRPGASLLRALIARDERHDALIAVQDERVVGHAMSFRGDGATEIAVVVADEWQGHGIGSRLVGRLVARAAAGGADHVGMDVMGENRKVLSMIRRRWPDAAMRVESGTVAVIARIL